MTTTAAAAPRKALLALALAAAAVCAAPTVAGARVPDPGLDSLSAACFSIQSQWDAAYAGFKANGGISTPAGEAYYAEINRLWGIWRAVCQGTFGNIYLKGLGAELVVKADGGLSVAPTTSTPTTTPGKVAPGVVAR